MSTTAPKRRKRDSDRLESGWRSRIVEQGVEDPAQLPATLSFAA
ncbi:MAG TPA: hypothetical protein VHX66_08065 [Solirubrobacteraceae bacterium]|nr:hypothetical protein [Solirubrobacteraceae bacterium]